jgi:hypothetical protein
MCGSRKFALEYITRDDIVTLTREAADVTGITYIMDADKAEVQKIFSGKGAGSKAKTSAAKPKTTAKPKTAAKEKTKGIAKTAGKKKGKKK